MNLRYYALPTTLSVLLTIMFTCASGQVRFQSTSQQIQRLIAEKKTRTPTERKISSQLLQAVREASGRRMVEGLQLNPANVNADSSGNLLVDINAEVTNSLPAVINAMGGKIIYASQKFHSLRVQINLSQIRTIAGNPAVRFIKPAAKAHLAEAGIPVPPFSNNSPVGPNGSGLGVVPLTHPTFKERAEHIKKQLQQYMLMPGIGSATSEGDHTMGADSARKMFGYQGQGIRIAVLSDSYDGTGYNYAAADVATGDLPGVGNPFGNSTPVTVVEDYGYTDEGRAMLQIVHDVAPKAQLFFATAFRSEADFADNILALRAAPNNCDIIIDDVIYYDEPAYQDGMVAQAVNTVTADGALYFSSAGNGGSVLMNYASIWEGDFNDAGSLPFTGNAGKIGSVHNFGTIANPELGDTILPTLSAVYNLKWADPLGGSTNDYDLFIVTPNGNVTYSSTDIQDGTQDPYEEIDLTRYLRQYQGYQLLVFKASSAKPVTFVINANTNGFGPAFKYTTPGLTYGHSGAVNAFSVAATPAPAAYPSLFTTGDHVEYFSSDGPRHIFFNADSTPITPGNFLLATNGGTVRKKPDITAADGVSTTFPNNGLNPFYGTSAAAPHAAAIAALVKSANPTLTNAQIRNILTSTALDIEAPGYDINSGYGIVQAFRAVQAANPKPRPTVSLGQVTVTEAAFSNHNGTIDPGEVGNMVVQFINPSLANATNLRAVVSSSVPGVTVTQDSAFYGSILKGGNRTNMAAPFVFTVGSSVPCGSKISFSIVVSLDSSGSNAQAFTDTVVVGTAIVSNITSILGSAPPPGPGYTAVSGQQTGKMAVTYYPSYCSDYVQYSPGLADSTGLRQFDAYTFTNISNISRCVTVTVNCLNYNIFSTAYDSAGFVPTKPSTNYLGQAGYPAGTMQYNFTVHGNQKFTVVVNDVYPIPASGSAYSLHLQYTNCNEAPPCSTPTINQAITTGATGVPYIYAFGATGGSGAYQFSLTGNLPPGLTFNAGKLFGTPTQAGSFPLTITLTDPLACKVTTTLNDTLKIDGIVPESVTAYSGATQSTPARDTFAHALQAKVFGKGNIPLSGVNVIFTAPINLLHNQAAGTFAGGVDTVMAITDSAGVATATTFTADSLAGSYFVYATVNGVTKPAQFTLTNTCINTMVTTNANDGHGSLRYIVANACPAAAVTFAPGINNINLTTGEIAMFKSISVIGPGADKLAISGNKNSRIFRVAPINRADSINIGGVAIVDGLPQDQGGGGIYINGGNVGITGCLIANNDASFSSNQQGGGIFAIESHVTVTNSSIVQNAAIYGGGGIESYNGNLTVNNCTIAGNVSAGTVYGSTGGGLYFLYGALKVTNSTVYGNTAIIGANIYGIDLYYNTGRDTLQNTIVAGGIIPTGTGGTGADLYGTSFVSLGYNLVQDTTAGAYTIVNGFKTTDIRGISPNLRTLRNFGGHTPTLLPKPNSPVIGAGYIVATNPPFDQRGYNRTTDGGTDIGAVETNYAITAYAGTPQSTAVNTQFAGALKVQLTERANLIDSVPVIYNSAPATVASGTFGNGKIVDTFYTGKDGIAQTIITANNIVGNYKVTCSIGGATPPANFYLTNTKALAVTFGRITASLYHCTVQITWQTLTGEAGETFTVEHSTDGLNYAPIYATPAKGNSIAQQNYTFTHLTPSVGANYYRVKQTDINGSSIYSATILAVNTCSNEPIIAYPNPVHNTLKVLLPATTKQSINIFDAWGRLVARYASAVGNLNIDVSKWAAGTYTLYVVKEDKTAYSFKVIKN